MTWLTQLLVGRVVQVHADGLKVYGRLVAISDPQKRPIHKPGTVIVETAAGLCIVREWSAIAFGWRR